MTKLKFLAAALLATAATSAPVMARESHARHRLIINAAGSPGAIYLDGRTCVPAPRIGAFATAPWGYYGSGYDRYGF
jgi:hypothetical protein